MKLIAILLMLGIEQCTIPAEHQSSTTTIETSTIQSQSIAMEDFDDEETIQEYDQYACNGSQTTPPSQVKIFLTTIATNLFLRYLIIQETCEYYYAALKEKCSTIFTMKTKNNETTRKKQ